MRKKNACEDELQRPTRDQNHEGIKDWLDEANRAHLSAIKQLERLMQNPHCLRDYGLSDLSELPNLLRLDGKETEVFQDCLSTARRTKEAAEDTRRARK